MKCTKADPIDFLEVKKDSTACAVVCTFYGHPIKSLFKGSLRVKAASLLWDTSKIPRLCVILRRCFQNTVPQIRSTNLLREQDLRSGLAAFYKKDLWKVRIGEGATG